MQKRSNVDSVYSLLTNSTGTEQLTSLIKLSFLFVLYTSTSGLYFNVFY